MNILVIGGNGFLGSHLVDSLYSSEHNICVFDRQKNKYVDELENIHYVYGDFSNLNPILKILDTVDIVYHLLSTTVPTSANRNPKFDIESNLLGTINLLEILEKSNVKKFVYISSGGTVYGSPKYLPIDENHILNPVGSYGITKVAIESYIKFFSKKFNIPYLILRPSNPYGPRQNYLGEQGVISTFLYKTIKGHKLDIWGDGSIIRDYIYIDDVVELIVLAGLTNDIGTFNLGSGSGNSINEIIKKIEDITKLNPVLNYTDSKQGGVKKVVLDISKSKSIFDWEPKISLADGIKKHYKWLNDIVS